MAYLSLYRKYRSQTFAELLGQEHVSQTLSNAIAEDRVAHAYLFTGPRGTGKTSTARILAKALNCARGPTPDPCGECDSCVAIAEGSSLDVIEMDAASHSKVDETREILAGVPLATAGGRRKVYVIDEVHMLSAGSFNALLKTLEEPPQHVVFILATTEAHKVLPTIVSRTQRFDFRRIPADVLEEHLARIAKLENIDIDQEALLVIARHADGSARDALSSLDQLASLRGHVSADDAERLLGERREDVFVALFAALVGSDPGGVFTSLHQLIAQGADPRQVGIGIMQHARSLLLVKTAPDATGLLDVSDEDRRHLTTTAEEFSVASLTRVLELVATAVTEMRNAPNHRLLLEVALVRAAAPETDPSTDGLLARIERLERSAGMGSMTVGGNVIPAAGDDRSVIDERDVQTGAASRASTQRAEAASAQTSTEPSRAEEPSPPTTPEHVGFNHVRDAWPTAMKEVSRRSKHVWGLLSPSRPVSFDDSGVVVEVQSDFHKSSMSEERNRDILLDGLHAALGIRPDVSFVARGERATPPPEPSVADYSDAKPVSEGAEDPVELIRRGLGAEVVEEK